jgi:uncharacterized protein involved in exopolysaccharide biosynthesis
MGSKPPYEIVREQERDGLFLESGSGEVLSRARERSARRLRRLWEERRFLLRAALYGLAVATLVAFLIPKQYTSTAQLMPPSSSGTGSMAAALAGLTGQLGGGIGLLGDSLGLKNTSALFVGILNSDRVRDAVIDKFHLRQVYHTRYPEDARKILGKHTTVSADRQSEIITISIKDHSPQRAAAMAQKYVDELNCVVNHLSTSSARRERLFLEERLEKVKSNLESAEKDFSRFASQNTAIDIPEQGKAMVSAAATLQGNLIGAESEREALRQIYTDSNVRVRAAQARVSELRRELEKIGGKGTDENSSAGELYPTIRELPVLGVTYADRLRRVKVEEAVFETLTQEYELARVQEARDTPTVKVLDPPLVPEKKSFPPRLVMMLLGVLLALALAIVWVLARARWEETDPTDPRKALAQEVYFTLRAHRLRAQENGFGSLAKRVLRHRTSDRNLPDEEE